MKVSKEEVRKKKVKRKADQHTSETKTVAGDLTVMF